MTNANIGFGIKESKFIEQQESIIVLDNIKTKSSIFVEEKSDIFKNQLNKSRIFSKYLAMAKRKENQLHFLNNFFEDAELLKKYGLSKIQKFFLNFKSFHLTYYYDSPSALVTRRR